MDTTSDLAARKCQACEGGVPPLTQDEAAKLLKKLDGWLLYERIIGKTYEFKNYYQTIAFVNGVAWISHREDHHPELTVSYNKCHVEYTTHAVNGLSENDFICAAKVDALFKI